MEPALNKKIIAFIFFLLGSFLFSQVGVEPPVYSDYKDPEQHKKFYKRRKIVSEWQINQLKEGALVVKLKTNKILIEALSKRGDSRMAEKIRLEALARNLNITRAYNNKYNFSKVYFIYSTYADSLLKGARSHIFLDSTLVIDTNIIMREHFYLIAETDNIYNSSIGFVPEDSAKFISEKGSKTTTEAAIVLKNKYGHQLKKPFPYLSYEFPFRKAIYNQLITINAVPILFNADKKQTTYLFEGKPLELIIPADFTYTIFSYYVDLLNDNLHQYFRESPKPDATKIALVKPFLY